jgi:hypothetical protein
MIDIILGILAIAGGSALLLGAIFDWEWLLGHPSAQAIVRAMGRGGARILYGLMGLFALLLGIFSFLTAFAPQ